MLLLITLPVVFSLWYPEQVHIAWTGNPHEMQITWICYSNSKPDVIAKSSQCMIDFVEFDLETKAFDFGQSMKRVGFIHTAKLKGILQWCEYEYQVVNGPFKSDVFKFKGWTPGDTMNPNDKMIIYGDLGVSSQSGKVIEAMEDYLDENSVKGLIQLGDFAYDLFTNEGLIGDRFGEMMEPITSSYPFMTIPGNHELKSNFSHYINRYPMPKNAANQGLGLFYSFEAGLIKYILLNTNVFLYDFMSEEEKKTQLNWLDEELSKADANRERNPWIVVLAHQPLYCLYNLNNSHSRYDCVQQTAKLRKYLEEPYNKYHVDLVITGHMHKYERYSTVYNDSDVSGVNDTANLFVNPKAPVYVLSGNGGNDRGKRDPNIETSIDWFRAQSQKYGFGVLTCFNQSHLQWEQLDTEEKLVDFFTIVKHEPK